VLGLVPLHVFIAVKMYLNQGKPYLTLGLFHLVCSNFGHKPNDRVMTILLFVPFFKQQNLKFKTSKTLSTYAYGILSIYLILVISKKTMPQESPSHFHLSLAYMSLFSSFHIGC
jgi:hypothetical protein